MTISVLRQKELRLAKWERALHEPGCQWISTCVCITRLLSESVRRPQRTCITDSIQALRPCSVLSLVSDQVQVPCGHQRIKCRHTLDRHLEAALSIPVRLCLN